MTTAALFPPNAKFVDNAAPISARTASPRTTFTPNASPFTLPAFAGTTPSRTACTHTIISITPAAPNVCPVNRFVELTATNPANHTLVNINTRNVTVEGVRLETFSDNSSASGNNADGVEFINSTGLAVYDSVFDLGDDAVL